MKTLIKGGRVIDPANVIDKIADVLVEDGRIAVVRIGEEYSLKRIFRGEDYLELRSENPKYHPIIIRGEQENAEILQFVVITVSVDGDGVVLVDQFGSILTLLFQILQLVFGHFFKPNGIRAIPPSVNSVNGRHAQMVVEWLVTKVVRIVIRTIILILFNS